MLDQSTLTLGFLDREPRSAGLALAELEPAAAASFLNSAPARLTAEPVSTMQPWSSARCVELMDAEAASSLLRTMSHVDAISILRLVDIKLREIILEFSGENFARGFRSSLSFRRDTVGAWMDLSTPSFDAASTVREAMHGLRRMKRAQTHIFLTDNERKFIGTVLIADLLRHDESAVLSEIADDTVKALSGHAPLVSADTNPGWDVFNLLPVVGRKQNLLGGLSRSNLRKGISEPVQARAPLHHDSVLAQISSAFVVVAVECANLALSTRQNTMPSQPEA